MDGFKGHFIDKEKYYSDDFDFSNFRERKDVYSFLLGEGPIDWTSFSQAYHQDRKLFSKYIGVSKSNYGYGDKIKWQHIDNLDCKHIFFSTFIFSYCKDVKQIVEIGGGYGNLYRLNHSVIDFDKWTIIDLPFVSDLQKWYISHEIKDLRRINFLSAYDYSSIIQEIFDLCIGSHSISELAWDDFLAYYDSIIKNSKYFFYAGHSWNCGSELLQKKLDLIIGDFDLIKNWNESFIDSYENYELYNNLYVRKNVTI